MNNETKIIAVPHSDKLSQEDINELFLIVSQHRADIAKRFVKQKTLTER